VRTKDVTVKGQSYQLRKMDPVAGSFVYIRMMGALLDNRKETSAELEVESKDLPKLTDEDRARMLVNAAIMRGLSLEDTNYAFDAALKCVSSTVNVKGSTALLPLKSGDGRWTDPDVADDASLIHVLAVESLVFSLLPFFTESGNTSAAENPAPTS